MWTKTGAILLATVIELTAGTVQQDAWQTLDKALQDGGLEHRQQAIAALATIDGTNPEAVRRAVDLLHDKSTRIRQSAALALGKMKARSAIPALQAALDDSGEVAFAAAKSLTDLGDSSGREMLIAVLAGDRKDTAGILTNARRTAEHKLRHPQGLILMGAEDAAGSMFPPAAMGIAAGKQTIGLTSKGTPGRAAATAYLAKDPDPYAVTLLEWALSDDSHFVRMEAAKGLGQRGNADTVAKLEPLLHDSHPGVRAMAAASIIRLSSVTTAHK